jgi:hypothetical protein
VRGIGDGRGGERTEGCRSPHRAASSILHTHPTTSQQPHLHLLEWPPLWGLLPDPITTRVLRICPDRLGLSGIVDTKNPPNRNDVVLPRLVHRASSRDVINISKNQFHWHVSSVLPNHLEGASPVIHANSLVRVNVDRPEAKVIRLGCWVSFAFTAINGDCQLVASGKIAKNRH